MIRRVLERTHECLGLTADADRWLSSVYQSANRVAPLYFLREVASVEEWLVHGCFIDDMDHVPIGEAEWRRGLEQAEHELGLAEATPYAGSAFLPAHPRTELGLTA